MSWVLMNCSNSLILAMSFILWSELELHVSMAPTVIDVYCGDATAIIISLWNCSVFLVRGWSLSGWILR